jgi:hypothetical protein
MLITFINSWRCLIKCSSWIGDEIKKYSDSSPCKILPHFTHEDLWKPHLWIIFHDFHSCSGAFKHDTQPIPTMTKRDEMNEMPVFSKPDPFRTVVSLATNESGNPDPHHLRVNFEPQPPVATPRDFRAKDTLLACLHTANQPGCRNVASFVWILHQ